MNDDEIIPQEEPIEEADDVELNEEKPKDLIDEDTESLDDLEADELDDDEEPFDDVNNT